MKILFISESYYPLISGVPVVVKYLAEGLAHTHNVSIATSVQAGSSLTRKENLNGVEINRFVLYYDIFKRVRGEINAYRSFVLNSDYDIIIDECAQTCTTDALLPVLNQIKSHFVLHAHGLSGLSVKPVEIKADFKHTIGNTYYWILMKYYYGFRFKRAARHINASISLSKVDSGYSYLCKLIHNNYVLGNAAEDIFFEPSTIPNPINLKEPYVVSIANYCVVKNQINLLRQFFKCKQKTIALVLIGSQKNDYYYQLLEEKSKLEKIYGQRNILILDGIDRKYFPRILDDAKAYLVSSLHEEYSISIIEAMARETPYISTNVGNVSQLPGGVVCNMIEDFPEIIDRIVADDKLKNKLGREAKEYAFNNCRRSIAVEKLNNYINEIMKN